MRSAASTRRTPTRSLRPPTSVSKARQRDFRCLYAGHIMVADGSGRYGGGVAGDLERFRGRWAESPSLRVGSAQAPTTLSAVG